MKIKLLTNLLHNGDSFDAGQKLELDDETAKQLIDVGAAEVLDDSAPASVATAPVKNEGASQVAPPVVLTQEQIQKDFEQAGVEDSPESQR